MSAAAAGGSASDALATAIARVVRWWVRAYTAGLPPEAREARRDEIECDIWEQRQEDRRAGRSALETSSQIAARWALGLPADLAWRRACRPTPGAARAATPGRDTPLASAALPRWGAAALPRAALAAGTVLAVGTAALLVTGPLQDIQRTDPAVHSQIRTLSERSERPEPERPARPRPDVSAAVPLPGWPAPPGPVPGTRSRDGKDGRGDSNNRDDRNRGNEGAAMNPKRLIYGTGAAVLVAGGLQTGVVFAQSVTSDQARAAALAHLGGGTVLEVELENERGRSAYEVEVRQANGQVVEVQVDPTSGAVLGSDPDDNDGPGRDDDD